MSIVTPRLLTAEDLWRLPDNDKQRALVRGEVIETMPPGGIPESYWDMAPDVAVEIVLPSESAADVREKVRDYLAAGTALVWVIYPRTWEVIAHTPDGLARTCSQHEVLAHFDILPEFTCAIAELLQ